MTQMESKTKPRIIAARILDVMQKDRTLDTVKKIRLALKKNDKDWVHKDSGIMKNLDWLREKYMVVKYGRKYQLLTKEDKIGALDLIISEIMTNLDGLNDIQQNTVLSTWLLGMNIPHEQLVIELQKNGRTITTRQAYQPLGWLREKLRAKN
jgi:hypothetical protein